MNSFEKMFVLFCAVALSGFFFHLGEGRSPAEPVPNCPIASCKEVYAWYAGVEDGSKVVYSAEQKPNDVWEHSSQALPAIYAPATGNGTTPRVAIGMFEKWQWANCDFTCDKINDAYPIPQEALPTLSARSVSTDTQHVCTPRQVLGGP